MASPSSVLKFPNFNEQHWNLVNISFTAAKFVSGKQNVFDCRHLFRRYVRRRAFITKTIIL